MKQKNLSLLYLSLAVLFWSTVATAFKLALREMNFIQLLLIASAVSMLLFGSALLIRGKGKLFRTQTRKDIIFSALLGLINPFLYYLILFKAYKLLPAQQAQPLNYTWAVMMALLSVLFLKQKLKKRSILALVISFTGVVVISTRGNPDFLQITSLGGVSLALGSSLFWALFWLLNLKDKRDPMVKMFTSFLFGTAYILITALILRIQLIPNLNGLALAAYVGLFEMGITFLVWFKALSLSKKPGLLGIYIYITPFLSLLLINFVLKEVIHPSAVVGLGLIVGGILLNRKEMNS